MTFTIQPINHIAQSGLDKFESSEFTVDTAAQDPHAIVLRSAKLHDHPFSDNLLAIARAGAGYNNVPVDAMTAKGIPVMNTPGANANAVKELVIAALLAGARNLLPAWDTSRQLTGDKASMSKEVESMKKAYAGFELPSRKLGVIGLGKIGVLVANACAQLGMTVWGYDPHISVTNAWQLDARVQQADSLETVLQKVDCLSVHVPLNKHTENLIDAEQLAQLPSNTILLNFSRGGIVNTEAVCHALNSGNLHQYLSDFPEPLLQEQKNAFCFPHLGASTTEAADNCAQMACDQLKNFLLYGQLKHCVNYPDLELSSKSPARLCVFNKNVPNIVAQVTQALSAAGININQLANSSRDEQAYNLIDLDAACSEETLQAIQAIEGVKRVRQIIYHD